MVHVPAMDARPVRLTAAWGLLVIGAAITLLALIGPLTLNGFQLAGAAPPVKALLVASGGSLALMVVFMPGRTDRFELLVSGLAALGGLSLIAIAGDPLVIAMLLLLLGVLHAGRPSSRPLVERLRNPVMAALLLGLGGALIGVDHNQVLGRVGTLGLVLGLIAAAGLVPFLHRVQAGERVSSSGLAWTAFFAPAVALVLIAQVLPKMQADEAGVFASLCLAFGLLNVAWGVLAAWRATDAAGAWRHTFIADWGLVLCGMGLLTPLVLGGKAAYLLLLSMLLVRLPLYVFAQPAIKAPATADDDARPGGGLLGLLVALALAGAAPFAGFAARLLLLQAAMTVAWPLAVVLLLAMLAYLAHCVRLGSSLGRPSRRTAIGIVVVLAVSTVLGVVPGVFLAVGGY